MPTGPHLSASRGATLAVCSTPWGPLSLSSQSLESVGHCSGLKEARGSMQASRPSCTIRTSSELCVGSHEALTRIKCFLAFYSQHKSLYYELGITGMIKSEHNHHHPDVGHVRFLWEASLGHGRNHSSHNMAPTWRLILPSVVVMNGAALRFDFVLPTPDVLFQFCTLLIITMDYDDNGLKILPKYTLRPLQTLY